METVYLISRNDGFTREELLSLSKDIVRACDIVSRLTKSLALECTDKHTQSVSIYIQLHIDYCAVYNSTKVTKELLFRNSIE